MRRHELRFGLLGPPVLYDTGTSHDAATSHNTGTSHDTSTSDTAHASGTPEVNPVGSPKVRFLLAALLLEAGRVVSVESLKDALWGGAPPASAQASLHNHVARLRRLLDDPERLRAVPPGYVLRVEQGELDVHVFERCLAAARGAYAARNWERVVRECTAALALWRGTPLSGLPSELGGYAFAQRLKEARLLLLEWRYEAELAVGDTRLDGLVPELAALTAEHPLREAYHRQLMLALHRSGRQAEALAVHRDLRARLVDELGVEPGRSVREAHAEVLQGTRASVPPPAVAGSEEPWQGPPASGGEAGTGDAGQGGIGTAGQSRTGTTSQSGTGTAGQSRTRTTSQSGTGTVGQSGTGTVGQSASGTADQARTDGAGQARTDGAGQARTDGADRADGADENPDPAEARESGRQAPAPVPAQLPPPPPHFTGRTPEQADLRHTLLDLRSHVVISGMAGVGKSALALQVAHQLQDRFPDGQFYVNLRGATPGMPPLTASQALGALLRDLGTEPRRVPEDPDAAAALLRSLLAPTRTLLVLDDAANAAQVRPLLPAGAGCAVIVTSRSPLTALDGARRFALTPLSDDESAALLRAASGRDALDAAHPLVELTGRLPLALRIVAARLAARHALTPDVLAGQLAATRGRLHHLEYDDLSVRRSLAVAHDALAASGREADRDAALVLRGLGTLDLPAYGAPLLAHLVGIDARRAEAALDRLVDVALLEETAYGRYAPHDLVRDYARELAGGASDVDSALPWYAAAAERVFVAIVEPGLDQDDRCRPTRAQPPDHAAHVAALPAFESSEQAFAWGDMELVNVVTLVERHAGDTGDTGDANDLGDPDAANDTGYADEADGPGDPGDADEADGPGDPGDPDHRRAARISTLIRLFYPYVQRSGRVAEMEVLGRAALRLARRLGDEAAEGYALGDLAGLHFLTGRQSEALALNDRALTIWRRLGHVSRMRRCLNNRGLLLEGLGRYEESGQALRQSLEYSRQLNDPHGEAVTHSHLGNLYEHTDPRAAIEQHRRSLAVGDRLGAVIVQHSAHCNIGYAHLTLGEPAAAVPHFEESLRILGGHGDWHGESQSRLGLVRALRLLGRAERADGECAELLRRADARADRYTGGLARHQHGLLLREKGRGQEAYEAWRGALDALDGTDENEVVAELRELLADAPSG